jgi:uncharacterized protein
MIREGEEIFFVDYDNDRAKTILYAPLRSYLALMSHSTKDMLLDENDNVVRQEFFKKLKSRAVIDVGKIAGQLHGMNPELSLSITDNCNLRCRYCHASAGEERKKGVMSHELIDVVLDSYFSHLLPGTKVIRIHMAGGGEPTFEFTTFKYAVTKAKEHASRLGITCTFAMATNGCYGNEVREFIRHNFHNVSLSFDGPPHIQNLHRPLANGKPSFEAVFETAKYFYSNRVSFAIRATVSDYSIEHLTDVVDFFVSHFPGVNVALEHLTPNGRALTDNTLRSPDKRKLAEKLVMLFEYVKGKPIKISNAASAEYDNVRPFFCTAVGIPNWTVSVDGEIVACARDNGPEAFNIGKVDLQRRTVLLDQAKVNGLRDMNIANYEECSDCFAKYHCCGDCPDRRLSDKCDCDSIRLVGKSLLNRKIDNLA